MAIYKFRVTYEDFEDVYRDIEVQSDMNLSDLHYAILHSVNFDSIHKGVFFESDHSGRRGGEILSVSPEELKGSAQKQLLSDIIYDPRQRFVYIYDEKEKWIFSVELIKVLADDDSLTLPRCVNKIGVGPKQYKETPLKFKSSDEPDGRKNRKKKEVAKEEEVLVDEEEDEDDKTVAKGKGKPVAVAAAVVEDDDEEEEDDSDAYEEEYDAEESGLKDDVFKADDEEDADDGDDDDEFGADDDDEFGGGAAAADDDDY